MYKLKAINKNKAFNDFVSTGLLDVKSEKAFPVIAGGAVRTFLLQDENPNDFDVFIIGDDAELKAKLLLFLTNLGQNIFTCPEGHLYSYQTEIVKIQLITPTIYLSISDLLDTFDLTPCRAAFDGGFAYLDKQFIRDVKKKVLNIHRVSYPVATMNRIFKYKTYGYNTIQAVEDFVLSVHENQFPEDAMFRRYID